VRATPKLRDIQVPLRIDAPGGVPPDLRAKLATSLDDIFAGLRSTDTHEKGLALELLALRLIRDMGLYPVAFRDRSAMTQQGEVDVVADGLHLHYSRWLVQCKNTSKVDLSDIAKEVGMAVVMKAHVIIMVTTGRFTQPAIQYANGLAENSSLQAILIDKTVLDAYRKNGETSVIDHLRNKGRDVLRLKAGQIVEIESD
jgi:hypothetical protein